MKGHEEVKLIESTLLQILYKNKQRRRIKNIGKLFSSILMFHDLTTKV